MTLSTCLMCYLLSMSNRISARVKRMSRDLARCCPDPQVQSQAIRIYSNSGYPCLRRRSSRLWILMALVSSSYSLDCQGDYQEWARILGCGFADKHRVESLYAVQWKWDHERVIRRLLWLTGEYIMMMYWIPGSVKQEILWIAKQVLYMCPTLLTEDRLRLPVAILLVTLQLYYPNRGKFW